MLELKEDQKTLTAQPNLAGLKATCYFVCLLALFLSISPKQISCLGLFLLLLFAPLNAAHWLRSRRNKGKIFLLLAVSSAIGVLVKESGVSRLICFCISLLFWSIYLCRCVFDKMSLRELCHAILIALFSNPGAYFTDIFQDWEARRKRLAKYAYTFYILAAVFIGLVLLLFQSNDHFTTIFQALCILILRKVPLVVTCLLLALFPAAFIYGFLKELKTGVVPVNISNKQQTTMCGFAEIPWEALILMLIVVNWALLIVEIYYTIYIKDAPLPEDYRFYDIFVILLIIFISFIVLHFASCYEDQTQRKKGVLKYISLSISGIGLTILVCWRLGVYIYYHGLWKDRIIFCFFILLCIPLFIQSFINCEKGAFTRCISYTCIMLLAIALIYPKGLILTQINTQIFIHKYHTQQLSTQRDGNTDAPIPLSEEDLNMSLLEDYEIEAIPALTWLVKIEDVTYQDKVLGEYARSAILNCLCEDLKLTRTGDDVKDLMSIYSVYVDIPRYRLPTKYALALNALDNVKDSFH